jgi:hypothetical protein
MNSRDAEILVKCLNRFGPDVLEKQEIIRKKAEEGRKLMNLLKMGIDIKIDNYNEAIMNLLHYSQYNIMIQQVFLEWHSDEIIESNGETSEHAYIEAGKMAKQYHDAYNEELFELTLTDLLFYKANGDEDKIDKLYEIYHGLMGREWLDAKFLKSLKKE